MAHRSDFERDFRISLAMAGLTQADFAEKVGVTSQLVSRVLTYGSNKSARVYNEMSRFIRKTLSINNHRKAA